VVNHYQHLDQLIPHPRLVANQAIILKHFKNLVTIMDSLLHSFFVPPLPPSCTYQSCLGKRDGYAYAHLLALTCIFFVHFALLLFLHGKMLQQIGALLETLDDHLNISDS